MTAAVAVDIWTVTGQPTQLKRWDIGSVGDPGSENKAEGNWATLLTTSTWKCTGPQAPTDICSHRTSHTRTQRNEVLVYPREPITVWQFLSPNSKDSQFHEFHLEYLQKCGMLFFKWKPLKMHSLIRKCGVSLWVLSCELIHLFIVGVI